MTATSDGGHLAELRGTTWDAIVVGAGPAGSLAARRLSRAGASVLLVEKKCFPRPKVCGACLSPSALTELDRAGLGSLAAQLDAVELGEFHFRFRHRSLRMAMSGGKALSRERLDEALARSAVEAGARLLEGTLAQVEPVFNDVRRVLLSQHGRCAHAFARTVLVAAGFGMTLTTADGAPVTRIAPGSRIGAGCRLPHAPLAYPAGQVFMAAGAAGYVGIVRLEDGSANVAAAFDPAAVRAVRTPAAAALQVLAEAGAPEIHGLADATWLGTAPLTRRTNPLAQERLFFLGDSAGYVEPFTGEGIAWALASARAIEPLALKAVTRWHPRLADEWARTHRRLIGRRQLVCRALALGLQKPWLIHIGFEALDRNPLAARGVMRLLSTPSLYSPASGT